MDEGGQPFALASSTPARSQAIGARHTTPAAPAFPALFTRRTRTFDDLAEQQRVEARLDLVTEALRALDPDVIALQEASWL